MNKKVNTKITNSIWDLIYRYKSFDGSLAENSIEDTWRRVAKALSVNEINAKRWEEEFFNILKDFQFIPAGRITAGAGTSRNVTLINAFVMPSPKDSLESILDVFNQTALTLRMGGGLGIDFSSIRPKGAVIKGVESDSSGPIPFMEMWDQMCSTIMKGGLKRGAMMGLISCDHPDIIDFLKAKRESNKLTKFNFSILVTDKFMDAIRKSEDWDLTFDRKVYKTIKACDLWKQITKSTYNYSEPGVIFIDRINKLNNLKYCEKIIATNSCGEQPLPEYGSCPLGSVNLTQFVEYPFTKKSKINFEKLGNFIHTAVRLLDNVISVTKYPVEKQRLEAIQKRRIGLGFTGLADALAMCGLKYASLEGNFLLGHLVKFLQNESYSASAELAKEKGVFTMYNKNEFKKGYYFKNLKKDIQDKILLNGMRNSTLNCFAPTGTSSLFAGNLSSGIEPIFDLVVKRTILKPNGKKLNIKLEDYAYALFKNKFKNKNANDFFITAQQLNPNDHILVQSIAQKYIDGSISKTINCPAKISYEDFQEVYFDAYQLGCKGCTTFRPSKLRGSIINKTKKIK